MRFFPALVNRLLETKTAKWRYWSLVDRIAALTHPSAELNSALSAATAEIGKALDLVHCALLLDSRGGLRVGGTYSADTLDVGDRDKLRVLDLEVAREMSETLDLKSERNSGSTSQLFYRAQPAPAGKSLGIKSVLAAPLSIQSESIGALLLYSRSRTRWSRSQKRFVKAVASNLSLVVHHFQSEERAKIAADREILTNKLLTGIRNSVEVDEILKAAVDGVGKTLNVTRAVVYMHPDGDLSRAISQAPGSFVTARAEYRASPLVPSLLDSHLEMEASPMLGRLLAGEMITIPDGGETDPIARAVCVRLGVRALALAPISNNGRTVAALAIEHVDGARALSSEEVKLLQLVTEQAAVAIHNAELYREASESARREALISKISSAVHRSLDSDEVLQAIVNELGKALLVCRCRIALLPSPMPLTIEINNEYVSKCCLRRPAVSTLVPVSDNPHLQAVLSSDRPVVINDATRDHRLSRFAEEVTSTGVKSLLATTIKLDGRPIGFLSLHQYERHHHWTQWEIDVVESVAEQAAVAFRQAELHREVRESATRAALANQMVAAIRRSLDLDETLQVAADELGRALGANRTYFRKFVNGEMVTVASYLSDPLLGIPSSHSAGDEYMVHQLQNTRRTLVFDDVPAFIEGHPEIASSARLADPELLSLSQIICPVFVNGEFWGALTIGQTDRLRKWTASEVSLIEMVTAQIEVAVSHSHLYAETKRAAEREALISHITLGINQSNSLDEIFPLVACELAEHLSADRVLITKLLTDSWRWVVECEYADGRAARPEETRAHTQFANFAAMLEDDVVLCNDIETDPRVAMYLNQVLRPGGTRAFMAVRLFYKNQPRLVITVISNSAARTWTEEEVEIIRAATDQVFIALQRAELFAQVSRAKFEWEATFDALSDGILIFDQDGILRKINQAGAAYEGGDVKDLIGRRCCTLLQGAEQESCRVSEVMRTGRPTTFEVVPERLSRPVVVTISPLEDAGGDVGEIEAPRRGAVCIVRDLSELRAAEAIAREQRSFLVKLIEHANDAIFAFSSNGKLIWFNDELVKLSGYTRVELSNIDYRMFLTGEDKKIAIERFGRALLGEPQNFEMQAVRKGGEQRMLLITYTPIYDEGGVTSVLSIARDVTVERLASERAAQADKLRALGQLASGVAHNFNNILAAILGHAQLLKRDFSDERLNQRIDIIERAALDGAQTVKRIQAFGVQEAESGQDVVDIAQLVQDSTTLTRARWADEAQARGLHYDVQLDLKPVPFVRGRGSELREVFVNIILNALDAMPQGGMLKIKVDATDSVVRTSFTDSGLGMRKEVVDHIFEPFFSTKGSAGMGLGLAVSYSIIERHGGRIDADSSLGRGTTFTITLPIAEGDRLAPDQTIAPRSKPANVLVIDDDERVREILVGLLTSAGHTTNIASNGREALSKMARDAFDLVFTDLSMPEMDGWTVANEIRSRWPNVKIVLITGYGVPSEAVEDYRKLVNDVVSKPIQFDEINATLSQILN